MSITGKLAVLAAAASVLAFSAAGAQQKNDPQATLQRYLDAVNSARIDAVLETISDDLEPFTYTACTPGMTSKQCLGTFVNTTIIKRHGSLVSPSATVKGDVIDAVIEVRHDATRAAGIPRMIGIDRITVKNNKIVSFSFKQDPNDKYNKQLAAFNAAQAAAASATPPR